MGSIKTLEPTRALHARLDALLAQEEAILNARVAPLDIIGMRQQHAQLAQLGVKLAQEGTTTNVQHATLGTTFNLSVQQ